jgi:hypothetical protein
MNGLIGQSYTATRGQYEGQKITVIKPSPLLGQLFDGDTPDERLCLLRADCGDEWLCRESLVRAQLDREGENDE